VDYAIFLRRFGKNLHNARWLTGMTQQQVAAKGVSYRWYVELERGLRNPTLQMVFDLAQILGVAPADLVDVAGARPGKKRLSDTKATPPKRGRKPNPRRR